MLNIKSESISKINNKLLDNHNVKPNEDYFISDDLNNIYIVSDGISRPKVEYQYDIFSYNVSKLFCDSMYSYLLENRPNKLDKLDVKKTIINGFNSANKVINSYLENNKEYFITKELPGCVGIISLIIDDYLYYASFGDCMGLIIRDGHKIIFSQKQTEYVFSYLKEEKNRDKLYHEYANKDNIYGYSIVNGDINADINLDFSFIKLEKGDTIYLVSDGVSDYIEFARSKYFNNMTLDDMLCESDKQDKLLLKSHFDDKTIIRIHIN